MPDKQTFIQQIEICARQLNLEEAVIEKDVYVTQAIHALSQVKDAHFSLVFQGGTALVKAHQLVQRMSEDCDFRIYQHSPDILSKSAQRKALRQLRESLISALKSTDFVITDEMIKTRNEGQFISIAAEYPAIFDVPEGIKPHLALELFLGTVKTPIEEKPVTTLIRQTLGKTISHPEMPVKTLSLMETAAEKWVALTRRIATIEKRSTYADPNLIRHLYDLTCIYQQIKVERPLIELITRIVQQDREQFKTHNLTYAENPAHESKKAIVILRDSQVWKQAWQEFTELMVYGDQKLDFKTSIKTFNEASQPIIAALTKLEHELEKSTPLSWLDQRYQQEWENLRAMKEPKIKLLVEFYDVLKKGAISSSEQTRYATAMGNLIKKLVAEKATFEKIKMQAPMLSNAFPTWLTQPTHAKNRGRDLFSS